MRGKKYIELFKQAEERTGIPAAYYYALARAESGFNPRLVMPGGGAIGLMQTVNSVIAGFNKATNSSLTRDDMLNPRLNVRVASWMLGRIRDIWKRHGITIDWKKPSDVAMFTQGWNSGPWGMLRLLLWQKKLGVISNVDTIRKFARDVIRVGEPFGYVDAGLSKLSPRSYRWLADRKTTWAKGVARNYERWRRRAPFQ